MWDNSTLFHWEKSITTNIEKRQLLRQSIEKSSTVQVLLKTKLRKVNIDPIN